MARLRLLSRIPIEYIRTAWWGLVVPRVSEKEPLRLAQAVIVRQTESGSQVVLSLRPDVRGWELPGGTLEPSETYESALKREVLEETGLRIEVLRHTGDYVRTGFRPHVARVYLCRSEAGQLRSSGETPEVAWFFLDAVPDTLLPWYRVPLEDAQLPHAEPVRRKDHHGVAMVLSAVRIDLRTRFKGQPAKGVETGHPPAGGESK